VLNIRARSRHNYDLDQKTRTGVRHSLIATQGFQNRLVYDLSTGRPKTETLPADPYAAGAFDMPPVRFSPCAKNQNETQLSSSSSLLHHGI
jgi:hypothetical protein